MISRRQSTQQEIATLAAGCFWCSEAIFKRLKGISSVQSGYAGGQRENPSYQEVCTGDTNHAEAIQITFDPQIISYQKILEVFWHTHDPTSLNRQGPDEGSQYRSVIFYHDDEQKRIAEVLKKTLEESGQYKETIVTEIVPFTNFYPAENYHRDYYDKNPTYSYCQFVIDPKIQKLLDEFKKDIKENYQ